MVEAIDEYKKYKELLESGYMEKSVYTGVPEQDLESNKKAMEERLKVLNRLISKEDEKSKSS